MHTTLAYFLAWTTYGTRLHGDERGTVDWNHNTPGTPFLEHEPGRVGAMRERMRDLPVVLSEAGREIVERVVRDHAAVRRWEIYAINVRTNHVHVVVDCRGTHTPELAMQQFKSWATRRLVEAGIVQRGRSVWTDHGSTRYLNDADSLMSAIEYVANRQ